MKKLCILQKRNINFGNYDNIITAEKDFVKGNCGSLGCRIPGLLLAERLAVSALISGGIHLVSTHQDLVQRTVVLVTAVMGTLLDGTFDTLVCMTVHSKSLLLYWIRI